MVDKPTDAMYAISAHQMGAFGVPSALGAGSELCASAGSRVRPRCSGVGSGTVLGVAEDASIGERMMSSGKQLVADSQCAFRKQIYIAGVKALGSRVPGTVCSWNRRRGTQDSSLEPNC
jgi:hypothetical protein